MARARRGGGEGGDDRGFEDAITLVDGDDVAPEEVVVPPLRAPGPQLRGGGGGGAPRRAAGAGQRKVLAAGRVGPSESRAVPVPALKGRLLERLRAEAQPRSEDALVFEGMGERVVLEHKEQQAAVALACVVLENLRRVGGSRLAAGGLEAVLEQVLPRLSAKELMDVEVEAYAILSWLGRSLDPSLGEEDGDAPPQVDVGTRTVLPGADPEQARVELIRRAVRDGFDLQILYYTGGRGELTTRRITPERIDAEKFLYAFCHTRQETRVFRISRIAGVEPVEPVRAVRASTRRAPSSPSGARRGAETRQASLFGRGVEEDEV